MPNAAQAYVAKEKITDYLLSPTNNRGRDKEGFFTRLGFRIDQWEEFADALRSHCQANEVVDVLETPYGIKYAVVGAVETPDGRKPSITNVWQFDAGNDYPRLVTAYPDT